jgi:predicted small secreted protein
MTKKIILTTVFLSASSFLLSACSTSDKLRVDVQNGSDVSVTSTPETISASPTSDPSTLSDEQLLLQMESDSDASIDQEFSRLDSELK